MIRGTGITLYYQDAGTEVRALDGVDIEVREREFVGIIGPSGSGKSSLLYILAGLKRPTGGEIVFRDRPFAELSPDQLASLRRKKFGFVFQNHFLIGYLTGIENILVTIPGKIEEADRLFEDLKITHVRDKYPHQMSAGEKQRVAIARAIAHRPEIIFADEPTASLDRKNAEIVVDQLRRRTETATLFVVTHDETILEGASRVIRLFGGKEEKKNTGNFQ